jgi:hypothetical protein
MILPLPLQSRSGISAGEAFWGRPREPLWDAVGCTFSCPENGRRFRCRNRRACNSSQPDKSKSAGCLFRARTLRSAECTATKRSTVHETARQRTSHSHRGGNETRFPDSQRQRKQCLQLEPEHFRVGRGAMESRDMAGTREGCKRLDLSQFATDCFENW